MDRAPTHWLINPLRMRSGGNCVCVCLSVTALAAPMLSYRAQAWCEWKQDHTYNYFDSWILLKALCSKVMPPFTSPIDTAIYDIQYSKTTPFNLNSTVQS